MCFFALRRYRLCHHDEIGPFAALCTTARSRVQASSNENNTQFLPHEKHNARVYECLSDPVAGSTSTFEFGYCGQPLFSPAYIEDFGPDSVNGGICQKCVEMGKLTVESNSKRDFQSLEGVPGKKVGDPKGVRESAYDEPLTSQPKSNRSGSPQRKKQRYHQQTLSRTPDKPFAQLHSSNPRFGNHFVLSPPQISFHHPLFQNQQPAQQIAPVPRQKASTAIQSYSYPAISIKTSGQDPENPPSPSTILDQMIYNYPIRTRAAIKKAVANQTPEHRAKTHKDLRTVFEERLRQQALKEGENIARHNVV